MTALPHYYHFIATSIILSPFSSVELLHLLVVFWAGSCCFNIFLLKNWHRPVYIYQYLFLKKPIGQDYLTLSYVKLIKIIFKFIGLGKYYITKT